MRESVITGEHPATTVAPSQAALKALQRPEWFRLPKAGGDPYFGLGRSYYYQGEQLGYWRLIRLRQRGKLRGVTLVPYDAVAAFIRKQADPPTPTPEKQAGYQTASYAETKLPVSQKTAVSITTEGGKQ
jgi:hypothetical protein